MADIEEKQRELLLDLDKEMNWDSGLNAAMIDLPEYARENLEEALAAYIDDKNNYVVEGAYLICDQMSKKPVKMYHRDGKLGIKGEGGSAEIAYTAPESGVSLPCFEVNPNETEIGMFHATNSRQTASGLRYGVITDRSCMRNMIEKANKEEAKGVSNLTSMGNCKIMRASDVMEIHNRKRMAKIYGTCYCLIQPDVRWENPYCMESVIDNCDLHGDYGTLPTIGVLDNIVYDIPRCAQTSHHKTMEWTSNDGKQEGLTKLSTLLCTRGGIITVKWSGQIVQSNDNEEEIIEIPDERYLRLKDKAEEKRGNWSSEDYYKIDFVLNVFPLLLDEERKSGIPAEILFAQMCIESGYGSSAPGNAYFGIKAKGNESSVTSKTKEEMNGKKITVIDEFKSYSSMEESIEDHTDLLLKNYKQYVTTGSVEDWCDALVKGGYATDSEYKQKIINTCKTWGLIE